MSFSDTGNTLATAADLGGKTYDVTTLGVLTQQEITETVGADDTADFFKFSVTQANALYLDLSATTYTKFQVLNSAGTALGTLSAGASSGSYKYMLNLDAGTYYLKAATADSTERASYIAKTLFAPTDTQTDTLATGMWFGGSSAEVKLGNLAANGTITQTATVFDSFGFNGNNSRDSYTFTLTEDAKVKFDLTALKNAGYTNLNISSQNGSSVGSLSISQYGTDTSSVEKQLLAGTYSISLYGNGATKYDSASGTSGTAPTKYQLQLSATASNVVSSDTGNTLATAADLGGKTYDVTTLGVLTQQEITETVGADDTADFFKFSVTQANALYLDLSATTYTKFQVLNSAGTALGTLSAGASSGSYKYMLNLDAGTYYLKAATADSTERASYIAKTLFAPTDTQTDTLATGMWFGGSSAEVKLGNLAANGTITQTATVFDSFGFNGNNSRDSYTFTLTEDAKVKFDLTALKNAGYTNLNISSQNGSSVGSLSISQYGTDTSSVEKQLLAGTYSISLYGNGATKYDSASGTSGTAPTKYQLQLTSGTGLAADTTPPTVTTFSPADAATGIAIASNIVLTFNEAISRGTGNIVLKTAAGVTVATYDAATSSNLTISGSTLTINPTADLANSTNYYVTFAPGSIKDLAGNSYAGTTSYDFTTQSSTVTPPVTSALDDFAVLQQSSPSIVGADAGNDTYLISGSMIAAGQSFTISDAKGSNSLQLANGLAIASSKVASNALQLTLTNSAVITINDANLFTYEAGGNSTAGINTADVSFATFAQNTLGVTVPSSGIASGGATAIGSQPPATTIPVQSALDDFAVLQQSSPSIVGADAGNDTYLISGSMIAAGQSITISDAKGSNSLQLANGLAIASSKVASTALQLTLTNSAVITINDANLFTYEAGGNLTAGINTADVSFATFAQNTLGVTVPSSGIASGGAVVIGQSGAGSVTQLIAGSSLPVTATSQADIFGFTPSAAKALTTNTQISLSQFDVAQDKLQFDLTTPLGVITLAALNGVEGISVSANAITNETMINFGLDANGDPVALTLVGITSPATVTVNVI
jgi:uncharacterized protein YxjI/methionine-rich copper-binding protein CopC